MTSRTYPTAVGVVLAVGLLFAAAGRSEAATDTPGTNSAPRGKVHIAVRGSGSSGFFAMSGALGDRGQWVDSQRDAYTYRTLAGTRGIIVLKIGLFMRNPVDCQCNWRITRGTKAYRGLHGRGHEEGMYQGRLSATTHLTMTGRVWR